MNLRIYLGELFAKIDIAGVPNDTASPKDPVNEGETVIGVLDDELKKMFALTGIHKNALNEKSTTMEILHHKIKKNPQGCDERQKKEFYDYVTARHYLDVVDKIFWGMVRESIPEATYGKDLDLRENWQVVATDKNDLPVIGPVRFTCRVP